MARGYYAKYGRPGVERREQGLRGKLSAEGAMLAGIATAKERLEQEKKSRRELLKKFPLKALVTDGKRKGRIVGKDENLGILVVSILPGGREERWAPEYIALV